MTFMCETEEKISKPNDTFVKVYDDISPQDFSLITSSWKDLLDPINHHIILKAKFQPEETKLWLEKDLANDCANFKVVSIDLAKRRLFRKNIYGLVINQGTAGWRIKFTYDDSGIKIHTIDQILY